MRIPGTIGAMLLLAVGLAGCETLKPYEKEYLLHPLMDDAALSSLDAKVMTSACSQFEKLSGSGSGGGATSCPTCGG